MRFNHEPCPLRDSTFRQTSLAWTSPGPTGELAPVIRDAACRGPGAAGRRPIAVVCDIRDDATARLRREGYIAAVQIPPQRIETGHLQLEVITGHLIDVHMRGDAPPFRAELAARAEQLKALNPFNQFEAERILLLASDIPGVDVRLTLAPARTKPGELIGISASIISRSSSSRMRTTSGPASSAATPPYGREARSMV